MTTATPRSRYAGALFGTAVLDLVAVAIFIAIGRRSHDEDASISGYLDSLWPFVVGLAVGWLLSLTALKQSTPWRIFPAGVVIWVSTVVVGMLLRWASHQGTAVAFIIVASISTAILLLGWRAIALILSGRRVRNS